MKNFKMTRLKPKTILITAGPTIEPIDPVRYLTNASSGKMGYALARAALKAGHKVILVSGPTGLKRPQSCRFIPVKTAREMRTAVRKHFNKTHIVFMAAAVADYRPKKASLKKIKKNKDTLLLTLTKNPDILKELGQLKKPRQTLVGFAAETHKGLAFAQKKIKEKNLDWIALNEISKKNPAFGSDQNKVTLVSHTGKTIKIPRQSKTAVASRILKTVLSAAPPDKSD